MDTRRIDYLATAAGARLVVGDPAGEVRRVTTDSRQAGPGDLFVALPGETFDGHSFVGSAAGRGVAGVLVEESKLGVTTALPAGVAVMAAPDTRRALGAMAARYRLDFDLPIVAVVGSNGKTTTKELVASVLRQGGEALWSEASFNNDIGVPLTLLRLERRHWAAVLEVGTNHPGELAPLLGMLRPRIGIVTSLGREHLEFFGDMEGVVREEGTIGEFLPSDGELFVPGDSPWVEAVASRARCRVTRVGLGPANDWRATAVEAGEDGVRFEVTAPVPGMSGPSRVRLLGVHQAGNALNAMAAGAALGLSSEQVRRGVGECAPPKMRMQLSDVGGVRILDDSYNANADSVLASLRTLAALPCRGRRVAVLGDMAELGAQAAAAHEEIGRAAAEAGLDLVVAVGRWASVTAGAARGAGLSAVREFSDVEAVAGVLSGLVAAGDLVLLKASRSTRLERAVEALRRDRAATTGTAPLLAAGV